MNERIRSEARKIVLAATALASAALFTSCESSQQNNPTPTLPEGLTRNINDYKYKVVIDVGSTYFTLFTNDEPTLNATGGQSLLTAQDVYLDCPELTKSGQKMFSCNKFIKGTYQFASPRLINVVPNTQTQ